MSEDKTEGIQEPQDPAREGVDWKAEARKWEARAKSNKEKADLYDQAEEAAKTELQKMTERAEKAEKSLAEAKRAAEMQKARAKVSAEKGVPADLIPDGTEDEMAAYADRLAAFAKPAPAPRIKDPGAHDTHTGSSDGRSEAVRMLFGND